MTYTILVLICIATGGPCDQTNDIPPHNQTTGSFKSIAECNDFAAFAKAALPLPDGFVSSLKCIPEGTDL